MSYIPIVASTAGVAAARRMRQEEEDMTGYSKDDLDGWEFKIVRANTRKFKDYKAVQQLCDEEAKAGWEMVEKFDDTRIRFKRSVDRRSGDRHLEFDPYRTRIGMTEATIGWIVGISVAIVALAVFIAKNS
ncbi:MAG: hypothetical protein KAT85_09700 [candidate division Zixibacteria bacterium]|nr:hypothetical protein [candidate division Zixibacteria bacterium]